MHQGFEAQRKASLLGHVAIRDVEAEVENTFAVGVEEAPLWAILLTRLAELELHVAQIDVFEHQPLERGRVRNIEFGIGRQGWIVLPRTDADRGVVGRRFFSIVNDDADMVECIEDVGHILLPGEASMVGS